MRVGSGIIDAFSVSTSFGWLAQGRSSIFDSCIRIQFRQTSTSHKAGSGNSDHCHVDVFVIDHAVPIIAAYIRAKHYNVFPFIGQENSRRLRRSFFFSISEGVLSGSVDHELQKR